MKDAYRLFSALADGNRLKILLMLREEEIWVNEIARRMKMSQPAVSHHLFVLKSVNLVDSRRNGKQILYSVNDNMMEDFVEYIVDRFKGEDVKTD